MHRGQNLAAVTLPLCCLLLRMLHGSCARLACVFECLPRIQKLQMKPQMQRKLPTKSAHARRTP